MSKPAFTPGPWRKEYDDSGYFHIQAENRPSPYIAATGGEGEINEVNADLYEALMDYFNAQRRIRDYGPKGDQAVKRQMWRDLHQCEHKAEAALRKACGEDKA